MAQLRPTAESARERAYLSWINSKISAVCPGMSLRSLDDEVMRNGTALAELIDATSASRIHIKTPCTTEADKLANVHEILRRLRELNVPISTIQAEDIVRGNKNSIMRLLLAISASFMPSHIHDIKHEIRDRHAFFGGQRVWHHITNVSSEAALTQRRFFPTAYRLQPITIHRLVPAFRPPLLHVATASGYEEKKPIKTSRTTANPPMARRISSHIYNRASERDRCGGTQQAEQESKRRSCENLVLREEQSTPMRASKSMSALHGRTFVSKLVIPHLRNVRSFSAMNKDSNSCHKKVISTNKNHGSADGYVNHGFSDSPALSTAPPSTNGPPPLAQMAKFRFDLAGVKSELMQLQEVLSTNSAAASGITQTASDYTLSSSRAEGDTKNTGECARVRTSPNDEALLRSSPHTMESLHRLLKVRTEAMDACLVDNAELRQAVGELTASLKRLQVENDNLRQRVISTPVPVPPSHGNRTWSFSSESIPNTPCSPLDTVQQSSFRLVNGQQYTTLT